MLIDSHCHLDRLALNQLGVDLAGVIKTANQAGVGKMLCVSIDLVHLPDVLAIADQYDCVLASAGLHPTEAVEIEPSLADYLQAASHLKVVAIGETGLDYYRCTDNQEAMRLQQDRFVCQIQAAKQLKKPLIIHTRQAQQDTIALMKSEQADTVGGVMHCFTESWEMAQQALALNFMIAFSGIVTFKNATSIQEVAQKVPLDRLLIETDSPYLAPVPHRGKTNQPAYVKYVAEQIANLRGIDYETVADTTTNNFKRLFGILD